MRFPSLVFSGSIVVLVGSFALAPLACSGDAFSEGAPDASADTGSQGGSGGSGGSSTGGAAGDSGTGGTGQGGTGGTGQGGTGGTGQGGTGGTGQGGTGGTGQGGTGGTGGTATGGTGGTGGAGGEAGTGGTGGTGPACDPTELPPSQAIYVSAEEGSDTTGDGSLVLPVHTVGRGLELATAQVVAHVILDQGTYAEPLAPAQEQGPLTVSGGWRKVGATWERDCSPMARDKTLLQSPTRTGVRVQGGGPIVLQSLSIQPAGVAEPQDNEPGASCYGVFASNAEVTLRDVVVRACAGGRGGQANKVLLPEQPSCDALTEDRCTTGESGASGPAGTHAPEAGQFTVGGYVPLGGTDGESGVNGANGTVGGLGTTKTCYLLGCSGGGGDCTNMFCGNLGSLAVSSQPGQCGCAGRGGGAGAGGPGGGGSFGLYAAQGAVVTVENAVVEAVAGGDGAPGQPGGEGSLGTDGQKGADASCPGNCTPVGSGTNCTCGQPGTSVLQGGLEGGPGGKGGNGGPGGGGSGGPSIAVLIKGTAEVNQIGVTLLYSTAGAPGDPLAATGLETDVVYSP